MDTMIKHRHQNKWTKNLKMMSRNRAFYVMVLPALVFFAIFSYWPMYGLQIAFRNFSFAGGITGSKWVGMKWFNLFFMSNQFPIVVRNTLALSLYEIAVGFPMPILLALIMHNVPNQKFRRVAQTATYMPHFISVIVLVGMMSCMFSINSGWVSTIVRFFGGTPANLMGEAKYFRHVYVWSGVWQQMGWNSIIYLAALTSIDPGLHEAAMIDGAGKLRRIWHVDLPGISGTIAIMLIMKFGHMMSMGFDKVFAMQNDLNLSVSEVITTYIYKIGLQSYKYSYSTAISLFNNIINFTMLVLVNKVSNKVSGSGLW